MKPSLDSQKIKNFFQDKSNLNYSIAALALVIYIFFFLIPTVRGLIVKFSEAGKLKAMVVELKRDWANIDSFQERLNQLNAKIAYYEKRLPEEKDVPAFLEFLSQAARRIDIELTGIQPLEQNKDAALLYYKVPISLSAQCGYHQLGRFINELEQADRFVKINQIRILAQPQLPDVHFVQLIIVTYVMKK